MSTTAESRPRIVQEISRDGIRSLRDFVDFTWKMEESIPLTHPLMRSLTPEEVRKIKDFETAVSRMELYGESILLRRDPDTKKDMIATFNGTAIPISPIGEGMALRIINATNLEDPGRVYMKFLTGSEVVLVPEKESRINR